MSACLAGALDIKPIGLLHQSRNGFAVPGDHNFFSLLNPVEQGSERIFSLESSNFRHFSLQN